MPVVTINDYDTLPSRNSHPFSRQCPNLRTCWPGLSASFNPIVPSRSLMYRRCAFLITLAVYVLHFILTKRYRDFVAYNLPSTILHILFLFFVAWNLHLIVNMTGERIVMDREFDRHDFDKALAVFVVVSLVLVACGFWKGGLGSVPAFFLWGCLDLAILGVAWVATWDEGLSLP